MNNEPPPSDPQRHTILGMGDPHSETVEQTSSDRLTPHELRWQQRSYPISAIPATHAVVPHSPEHMSHYDSVVATTLGVSAGLAECYHSVAPFAERIVASVITAIVVGLAQKAFAWLWFKASQKLKRK